MRRLCAQLTSEQALTGKLSPNLLPAHREHIVDREAFRRQSEVARTGTSGHWLGLWSFGPVLLFFTIAGVVGGGFAVWCVAEIDKAAGARNRALFERLLVEQKNAVALEQESTAVWDDALAAAKSRDNAWLEANIGVWNLDYAGHETSLIFDGGATPFFIAEHGRLVSDPDEVRDAMAVGSQLVRELRDIAAVDSTYHLSTVSSTIPRLTDFASIDGRPRSFRRCWS